MRRKDRIKPFMMKLADIWEKNVPDWRFGQLLVNVINTQSEDPFFFEEDKMLKLFEDFFKEDENVQSENKD